MSDTIKITETFAKLDKELGRGDSYILGLPGNKRLVFEDFTAWEGDKAETAEELLGIFEGGRDASMDAIAEKWLSAKDWAAWQSQKFSLRQKARIIQNASSHVLRDLSPGESVASDG